MSNRTASKIHASRMHKTLDLDDKNPINSVTSTGLRSVLHADLQGQDGARRTQAVCTPKPSRLVLRTIEQTNSVAGRFSLFQNRGAGSNSIRFA